MVRETADQESLHIAYRYPPFVRLSIYKLCCKFERYRQLCVSFPIVAAYIASPPNIEYGGQISKTDALDWVIDGRSLREISDMCYIPYHFRKIRPQNVIYKSELGSMTKEIADLMPVKTIQQMRWIRGLSPVNHYYGNYTGIGILNWLAINMDLNQKVESLQVQTTHIRDWTLAENITELKCNWKNSLIKADKWVRDLNARRAQELRLADEKRRAEFQAPFPKQWIRNDRYDAGGYYFDIEYLSNEQALLDEGLAMSHCVASYAWSVRANRCQIYSLSKNGEKIGTIEVSKPSKQELHPRFGLGPIIIDGITINPEEKYIIQQFRGKHNSDPGTEDKWVVNNWLARNQPGMSKWDAKYNGIKGAIGLLITNDHNVAAE